jgi:glycine/D-amino acid oxidase-like deaminating enzyme
MLDVILIGQGIAGSVLAWEFIQANQKILVIDEFDESSSSNIAAGITNPVTGRRLVKTWMADELLATSDETYRNMEQTFQAKFYFNLPILRLFDSAKAQNDWSTRAAQPEYLPYLNNDQTIQLDFTKINNPWGAFEINGGRHLQVSKMILAMRQFLLQQNALLSEHFSISDLRIDPESVTYKSIKAKQIVFCEGAAAAQNPFFTHLPFNLAKGECLQIKADDLTLQQMIKQDVFLLPQEQANEYFIGSTNQPKFETVLPTAAGRQELEAGVSAILKTPYSVLKHQAAIRPTVADRRPFVGFLANNPRVGIFNGLGTKGVSLAPYFAKQFVAHILEQKSLLKEVDIKRFLASSPPK